MPEDAAEAVEPSKPKARGLGATLAKRWRGWLRAVHRDFGYVAVGFTVIYALSGIAINHLKDWDPNFHTVHKELTIAPIAAEVPDGEAIARATAALGLGPPRQTYRAGDELHLDYDQLQVVIYGDSGQVVEDGRSPRFFLRVANWLHYNRGKAAWTYVADVYAAMLLYLALSGLFMIKGRLGLRWRGAILTTIGVAIPLGYVLLSGGPEAHSGSDKAPVSAPIAAPATAPPEEPPERPPARPPVRTPPPSTR
jgi:hypothetical protein